jgi:phospholipase/carboxylesterase
MKLARAAARPRGQRGGGLAAALSTWQPNCHAGSLGLRFLVRPLQAPAPEALHRQGQLAVQHHAPTAAAAATGLHSIAGVPVYAPTGYRAGAALVMLHGAGQTSQWAMTVIQAAAEREGFLATAPKSIDDSWDRMRGGYGPDVAHIDRALDAVFDRYAIDPDRLAIGGFSDGASYALSLGLGNGLLFRNILAFAPGFHAAVQRRGRPRIFVAHGTGDRVLAIDRTSRRIVPALQRERYAVEYVEFDGGHVVPEAMLNQAIRGWLTG